MVAVAERGVLTDPVAVELLASTEMAHLAYTATNGSPRVVPIWFHWTGSELVMASPERAPKTKALVVDPRIAVTIDSTAWPYHVLSLRGTAKLELVDEVPYEYRLAAERYMGPEMGRAMVGQFEASGQRMVRISLVPDWSAIIDFETRFPSAMSA